MKSLLKYFLIATFVTTLIPLSSCKKGAHDPFLSLRSRTSRLSGDWKLTDQKYTITQIAGTTTTVKEYTYDGTFVTVNTTITFSGAPPQRSNNKYSYTSAWTFNKDNSFTNTDVESGVTTVKEGNWAFLGKDKSAGLKNKEAIIVNTEKTTQGASVSTSGKTDQGDTWVLDELSNSKLIVTIDASDIPNPNNKTTIVGSKTYMK